MYDRLTGLPAGRKFYLELRTNPKKRKRLLRWSKKVLNDFESSWDPKVQPETAEDYERREMYLNILQFTMDLQALITQIENEAK